VKLILEVAGAAVNALTALSRPRRVPSLYHEPLYDPVKQGAVVVALKAKLYEVPTCFRGLLSPQVYFYVAVVGLEDDLA